MAFTSGLMKRNFCLKMKSSLDYDVNVICNKFRDEGILKCSRNILLSLVIEFFFLLVKHF